MGFYFSANSFAAVLVLLGVVSAGLAIQRRADGDEWGWSAVVLVVLAAAVWVDWLTGCRAALATPVVAAALMLLWRYDGAWLGRHRRGAFSSGVAAVLAGVAAVVIAGLVHGGLWQTSLTFRWRYWIGSARLWREHPWLGVGWGNFGAHYLAVRIQSAAEEIQDPHNFAVRATTELGIVGLLLILAWLMSGAWSATQVGELPITPPRSEPDEDQAARQLAKAIVWPLSLAILINIGASIDFTQSGSYVFYELLKRGLFFGLLVLGALIGMARGTAAAAMDDRAAPWIRGALLAALATFVLHNTIEFSIFETGPMCLFFFLAGAAIGVGAPPDQDNDEPDRSRAIAAFVMGICGWCAAAFVTIKMLDAESWAQSADEAYRTSRFAEADRDLANAIYASPVANSDYAYRRAEVAIAGRQSPGEIRAGLQAALFIDPTNVKAARTLGQFEIRQANPDAVAFSAAYERVLALDPCDVQARVEYADGLMRLGEADKAAAEYRDALRLNDLYDITEPKRLSAEEVTRIEKILQVLR
jgi:O-antigen ligase